MRDEGVLGIFGVTREKRRRYPEVFSVFTLTLTPTTSVEGGGRDIKRLDYIAFLYRPLRLNKDKGSWFFVYVLPVIHNSIITNGLKLLKQGVRLFLNPDHPV